MKRSLMLFVAPAVLLGVAALNVPSALAQENASYRHGVVPMVGSPLDRQRAPIGDSAQELQFQGGISGVGVTTGLPQVYVVFWGSQWGTSSVNSNGYLTFSNDPSGLAPDLQAFFNGLGTHRELWSGIITEYCQGVAIGATKCPTTAQHIPYPKGALAGVWEDTSSAAPAQASAHQLAQEAENAATHFGNTTAASNRNTQYFIVSPTGTDPDGYQQNGFCAWHDYSGDASMDGGGAVGGPLLAFTNMPYLTDVGGSCGAGFVNPGNNLDGVSIVGGHEYAETLTDQFPAGGWIDSLGEEIGDLCAWLTTGPGKAQNLLLTTGTFAVQGLWSNVANKGNGACAIKHAIVK